MLFVMQVTPEMAYAASVQSNPYAMRAMQPMQQQALLGNLPAGTNTLQQQQYGLNAGNSMQQQQGGLMQQLQQGSPYTQQQSRQPVQATPDRLGITPMQLAMLQQQRMQQSR